MSLYKWNYQKSQISLDLEGLTQFGYAAAHSPGDRAELLESITRSAASRFSSDDAGFFNWPIDYPKDLIGSVRNCAQQIKEQFDALVVIGIGGSYLGPYAVIQALRALDAKRRWPIHFVSNVDPLSMASAAQFVETHRAATIVVSKSGQTTEVLVALAHLHPKLEPGGIIAVTDPTRGTLRKIATENGWRSFDIPRSIGGRFSVLTAVGLLSAQCAGLNSEALLAGARSMRESIIKETAQDNAAANFALELWHADTHFGAKIQYLMPYWSCLRPLADWYVQLWAESLGKHTKMSGNRSTGPTPVAALGSSDQHSVLQLLKDGPRDKIVGFIDCSKSIYDAQIGGSSLDLGPLSYINQPKLSELTTEASIATQESLRKSGVPTYRVHLGELSELSIGAWLFFMETACAYSAELYGVDAYDQPGVEQAKQLLNEALSRHAASPK